MLGKKTFLLAVLQASLSLSIPMASGSVNSDSQIEGANLICTKGDDVISINSKSLGDERVWIGKKNSSSGTEVSIKSFFRGRCETCFEVKATSDFIGQTVHISLSTSENRGRPSLLASFSQFNESFDEAHYQCKKN